VLPFWSRWQHLKWQARNLVTCGRPVAYTAGQLSIALYPEGQIAEFLWLADFELADRNFVAAYLRPGMQVFNVGANVGLYSVLASVLVGEKGRVHAFEPSTESYGRLLRNLELNHCRNVAAVRLALSDTRRELVLRADPLYPSYDGHRFVESIRSAGNLLPSDEIVQASTLDCYVAQLGCRDVDFLIIDVEGAEFGVLEGGIETLTRANPTLLLECSKNQEAIENLLMKLGYRFWTWDMIKRTLNPADFREAIKKGNVVVRREGWDAIS